MNQNEIIENKLELLLFTASMDFLDSTKRYEK